MCTRSPPLPFLPGYTFNSMVSARNLRFFAVLKDLIQIGKTKFNRDPVFGFIGSGVRALVEKVRPNMLGPLGDKYPSFYPRGEAVELPAWIVYDKQVCSLNFWDN